jgi:glycosyltransferase involved in cell wall biosynthesis
MHVGLIVDEERLTREHAALSRATIGLIGEGVQVTRIVPDSTLEGAFDDAERRIALAVKVTAPMRVLPWMRHDRRNRLVESMEKSPPDVLYALGSEAWGLGLDLAHALDRPLAVDLWSAGQIRHVPRGRRAMMIAAYVAPTPAMADALRERVEPGLVCLIPMGVALPPEPRRILADPESNIALAIIGSGRDVRMYQEMLGGLARVVRALPQTQAFLELEGPHEHDIWRYARRLDLLENVSALTDASRHRALLTRCDALIVPEQFGDLRSLMLEAMTFGMPVIASEDPFLDMLEDKRTASVVSDSSAEGWARHVTDLLTNPDAARALGLAGRDRIAAHHGSSAQVTALVATFERIVSGGAYAFPEEG